MAVERRPDGALRFTMHVPLWTSLVVMAAFFGFGFLFAYGLLFEDTGSVKYRNVDLGFSLDPLVWKALFLLGTVAMILPGMFILLGILRAGKPYVQLDNRAIRVADRPMAADVTLRWDDIAAVERFRIQLQPAITLKAREGKNVQLSAHVFPKEGEFEQLCREIEFRIAAHGRLDS